MVIKAQSSTTLVINKLQSTMKTFAAALLAASAAADNEYGPDHYHNDYNTGYASAAPLLTPNFTEQVKGFEYRETLFGTENY